MTSTGRLPSIAQHAVHAKHGNKEKGVRQWDGTSGIR